MRNFEAESRREQPALPPIKITEDESRRLSSLANSSMDLFPRVAHFLAREMERATVTDENNLRGVIRMGSKVTYRDDETGASREIVLVYPHEANIELSRISVLTPVGSGLDRPIAGTADRLRDAPQAHQGPDRSRCVRIRRVR
ncbi:regulator of nucleoside diphosphate kinase [Bradyrhizobium sp. GM7.3]